jgi:intracellular sulfur oxidation DsrE/DsrF family protein
MKLITHRFILALGLLLAFSASSIAGTGKEPDGVVVQANGGDVAAFKRALVLASNMHEVLKKTKFEVVVYGPSVKFLNAFGDELPLIQKVQEEGIIVVACGRSLATEHMHEKDLASGVRVVQFGAVHIVERQKEGWQYIRP